jgi:predicted porin
MNRHTKIRTTTTLFAGVALAVCAAAQAQLKDPIPDSFSLAGITLFATIDVGYAYQSHGVPLNGNYPGGLEYQAFTTTRNFAGSQSTIAESGLEQSKVGLRVDQPTGAGFNLVATLETGFNPLSGDLTNACQALVDNSGVAQGQQTANADSSRCGQPFNSQLWGGVSNKQFGTLTIGRQNALQLTALTQYDPQTLSYAFSFLGYSGFNGGAGSTEAARWDNSAKYAYVNGPVRFAVMYTNGGSDTGILGKAYGADIGVTLLGLSVEGVYQHEDGAVNLRSSFDNGANPTPSPGLAAYISDDTSYNLMAKYVFDLPGFSGGSPNKLTAFAGYSKITKAHSSESYGFSQGDYPLDIGININDSAVYNMEWAGAKFAMPTGWSFTAAYYHIIQNSWTIGLTPTGTQGIGCSGAGLLCAGEFEELSAVVDYTINKHYDAYAGVNWSEVKAGLASGFYGLPSNGTLGAQQQSTFMIGYRIRL